MDDKTLVQRLDAAIKDDHERGCQGRYYSCTCGYDNDCSQAMQDAKSRIEALEAALRDISSNWGVSCNSKDHSKLCAVIAKQALEGEHHVD